MIVHFSDTSKSIIQQLIERADWDLLKRKLNEIGQNCKDLLMLSSDGYSGSEIVEDDDLQNRRCGKDNQVAVP